MVLATTNSVTGVIQRSEGCYVLARSHMRAERGAAWLRTVVLLRLNRAPPGCAQLCSPVCLRFCQSICFIQNKMLFYQISVLIIYAPVSRQGLF